MYLNQCPACLSKKISYAFSYSLKGFQYYCCYNCGGYFLNPYPNKKQISSFYTNQKLNKVTSSTANQFKKKWLSEDRFKRDHSQYIEPLLKYKKGGKLLDFGSGEGWFVHHATLNGFDALGVDFDSRRIKSGKKIFQGKLMKGTLNTLDKFEQKSFDVISILNIIEHLPNPSIFLQKCSRILKNDGIFMIMIPTVDSLQFEILKNHFYWFMAPYHINLFSHKGIKNLLSRYNFSIISEYNIEHNWYWTKPIVDKLNLVTKYRKWRKDNDFVRFDIELDKILDQIAYSEKKSSTILIFANKTNF